MQTTDLINDDDIVALEPERESLSLRAKNLVIKTAAAYEEAAGWLKTVKGALKTIEDGRNRVKQPLLEAGRAIDAQAKEAAAPWLEAEAKIKGALLTFQREQEAIQREEQRKANERAEAERRRLLAQQQEAQAKARAEADAKRKAAEEAAAAGRVAEAAKLAAQAERIEDKGAERAEALQDRAAQVVAPVVDRSPPKVEAIKTREVWKFRITNSAAIPREYLLVDEVKLRKIVQAMKADTRIEGIEVYSERQLAAGAA